jgi:hypothetical protein
MRDPMVVAAYVGGSARVRYATRFGRGSVGGEGSADGESQRTIDRAARVVTRR